MIKRITLGIVIFSILLTGCAKEQIYTSNPPVQTISNDLFEATLEPLKAERYNYYNSITPLIASFITPQTNGSADVSINRIFCINLRYWPADHRR